MKYLKNLSMLALLLAVAMWIGSCGQSENQDSHSHEDGTEHVHEDGTTHAQAHGEGTAFTSAYVCPMHCDGSGSEDPGTCPVCGMDYVALADHVKDGHEH